MTTASRVLLLLALLLVVTPARAAVPTRPDDPLDQTRAIGKMPLAEGLPAAQGESSLDKYVRFDDGAFAWKHVAERKEAGITIHQLRVTSQRWRSPGEVDRPLWNHWVSVAIPDTLTHRMAILVIGGGRHRDQPPETIPAEMLLIVRAAGAVVVYVDNIPNQPLQLENDGQSRVEDNIVARSWMLAMRDDDASWLVRFPMVKGAVKAMDAAEAFLKELAAKPDGPGAAVVPDGFFVVGASKRGWTTWLTAAVDPRVKGIAPLVIDVLNMKDHTPHHWRSYGFWAPALRDYEANGIPAKFGSPELARVLAHEDPLAYMARVKDIPKYIVNASGDEFFPTDSLRHYETMIAGEWRARCVPNTGHSLRNTTAPLEVVSFFKAVAERRHLPRIAWKSEPGADGATLTVTASEKPLAVTLYQCANAKARDFRFTETKDTWEPEILAPVNDAGTAYRVTVPNPATGFRAFLVECRFPGASPAEPLVFTTRVFITPDTLPFELPTGGPRP